MALWTPNDEAGLIGWWDLTTPSSYDGTAIEWTPRWGSPIFESTSGTGPTLISDGFDGTKNALEFVQTSDTDLKILTPGFNECVFVIVMRVTAVASNITVWTRTAGLGTSGFLTYDFGGASVRMGSGNAAEVYSPSHPTSAIYVIRHSLAARTIRLNGEQVVTNTVTNTGAPDASSDFLLFPYPGASAANTIEVAAVGVFTAASWSDELAEKIEGFIAHNDIGVDESVLPSGHPYKSTPPGDTDLSAGLTQTIADFSQTVTASTVNSATVSQTIADFSQLVTAAPPATATKLLDSNGWSGVTINPATVTSDDNTDQYLEGEDFDNHLWSTNPIYKWWILFITGNNNGSPITATYGGPSFQSVKDHNDADISALQFEIIADPPSTGVPQIRLTDYQTSGTSGNEPVFYQRMWIKFDENILARAQRVGSTDFYHIFWEPKCEPDYRMRVQLQYNGTKLYWVAHDDVLTNATHIHTGTNSTVDVVLAPKNSPLGWHKFEVWVDRPNGIWRAAVDGSDIINLDFGPGDDLYGVSGNIMNFPMFVQLYSTVSLPFDGDGPMYMLVDDLELWDQPPSDAWTLEVGSDDITVAQSIDDFSQTVTAVPDDVDLLDVAQTIDDFEQSVEVFPVIPEGTFNVNQFLADFSARLTVQSSIAPPPTPEYPTVGCGPGSYGAPVASAHQLLRREIHRPWPTR